MNHKIDWQLSNKTAVLVDLHDVDCKFEKNNYLEFNEEKDINYIDLKKQKYKRTTNEYIMEIDFIEKVCKFSLPTKESMTFDCFCSLNVFDDLIEMRYCIGDDEKIIKIKMKEE